MVRTEKGHGNGLKIAITNLKQLKIKEYIVLNWGKIKENIQKSHPQQKGKKGLKIKEEEESGGEERGRLTKKIEMIK